MTGSLSARSVIASTLLGTVPPRLPGRLLVAFAQLFGISEGATRVALSRMVERGELANDESTYQLRGELLARHHRQQEGLRPAVRPWHGGWVLYVVDGGSRSSADRAALRTAFRHLGVYEQREGVWLRPDNLDPGRLPASRRVVEDQTRRYLARPEEDAVALAAQLCDLEGWADTAAALEAGMDATATELDRDRHGALVGGFELAAATLRHLLTDPLLPDELWPADGAADRGAGEADRSAESPADRLRRRYADYDVRYRAELARFFSTISRQ